MRKKETLYITIPNDMRYYILCIVLCTNLSLKAQVTQNARYEIEVENLNESYFTTSAEENGLFIFKISPSKSTVEENIWEIIWLDSVLQEVSQWEIRISTQFLYKASVFSDNQLVILFQSGVENDEKIFFISYTLNDPTFTGYFYENVVPINITHFEKKEDALIFGGKAKDNVVVILFNTAQKKALVLPEFTFRTSELHQINVNDNSEDIMILTSEEKPNKLLDIVARHYSQTGSLLRTEKISSKSNKSLLSAIGVQQDNKLNYLGGSYALGNSFGTSDGLFISTIENRKNLALNYTSFIDLEHFFDYKGQIKARRLKQNIARMKKKNKELDMRFFIKVRDIKNTENEIFVLAEAYSMRRRRQYKGNGYDNSVTKNEAVFEDPRDLANRTLNSYTYNFRQNGYQSIYRFDHLLPINNPNNIAGFEYTQAFIVGFDHKGNKVWDNSIAIENMFNRQLKNFVYAANVDDQIVLLYLNDQQIHYKVIAKGENIKDKTRKPLKLQNKSDVLNASIYFFEGLKKWHDNTFYAYGVNSITNSKDGIDNERKVFFINKIVVD